MRKSIFSLAHEDDSELYGADTSGEITPEDMIESQADHDEFLETAASAQTDIAAIEESDDIVEDASDVAEDIDDKLEQPEKVTGDDVMVAQESMRIICHRYGVQPEAVLGRRLSHESASVNPVHSLRLAREGVGEFIKDVIEGIRKLFRRLIENIKKLYAKVVSFFTGTEKVASKMLVKVNSSGEAPSDAKFTEEETSKISNLLGALILSNGGKLGKDPVALLGNYMNTLQDIKQITGYTNVLKNGSVDQLTILNADPDKVEELAKKATKNMYDKLGNTPSPVIKQIGHNSNAANKAIVPASAEVIPFAVSGTKTRAFVVDGEDRIKSVTLLSVMSSIKHITVEVPTKASIVKLLGMVINASKKSKDFEAAVTKEVNDADKILAEMIKEVANKDLTPAAKHSVTNYLSAVRTVVSNVAVDTVLAQVNGIKAVMTYCAIASKKLIKS
jgi:hypothetical protein